MPLQETSGTASFDAFGGGVAAIPTYIEDVFSTYLYTGTGSGQTITNGIDLAGKGGLVWIKNRENVINHNLYDTNRGATNLLKSNLTDAQATVASSLTSFNSDGFSLSSFGNVNGLFGGYASWTFRKQPKFFDVVTYTGDGNTSKTIAHSLGSTPGFMVVKRTDSAGNWFVYHTSLGATQFMYLNQTGAASALTAVWNDTAPTSTNFTVGNGSGVNASGGTYVAYLFAHNAGGFGLTGTDNVISCGSYTADGTNKTIELGYEPQWVLVKRATNTGDWWLLDNMRGWSLSTENALKPNTSGAEDTGNTEGNPTATGFYIEGAGNLGTQYAGANQTMIYIAIRRGPMKTPTTGTSVFSPVAFTGNTSAYTGTNTNTVGFAGDVYLNKARTLSGQNFLFADKLRGSQVCLYTALTNAEENFGVSQNSSEYIRFNNTQVELGGYATDQALYNYSSTSTIGYTFQRAPGFFDEVCYTGTGSVRTLNHNLTVVPEMMIVKDRGPNSGSWRVYHSALGPTKLITLNLTNAAATLSTIWNDTAPTSSVFTVGTYGDVNLSGDTFVAYIFASCPGVSKVGSYTGTGTTKQIDCGFTGGARFVLIKRTDSTGDWYVWDSARGIVAGNDPYLLLNSTAAEVTSTDYIDTYSAGFEISSTAPAAINANGGTFLFLAIA